mgnify:CR=1 FL=1
MNENPLDKLDEAIVRAAREAAGESSRLFVDAAGQIVVFKPANANTTSSTLSVSGLTATAIKMPPTDGPSAVPIAPPSRTANRRSRRTSAQKLVTRPSFAKRLSTCGRVPAPAARASRQWPDLPCACDR